MNKLMKKMNGNVFIMKMKQLRLCFLKNSLSNHKNQYTLNYFKEIIEQPKNKRKGNTRQKISYKPSNHFSGTTYPSILPLNSLTRFPLSTKSKTVKVSTSMTMKKCSKHQSFKLIFKHCSTKRSS